MAAVAIPSIPMLLLMATRLLAVTPDGTMAFPPEEVHQFNVNMDHLGKPGANTLFTIPPPCTVVLDAGEIVTLWANVVNDAADISISALTISKGFKPLVRVDCSLIELRTPCNDGEAIFEKLFAFVRLTYI